MVSAYACGYKGIPSVHLKLHYQNITHFLTLAPCRIPVQAKDVAGLLIIIYVYCAVTEH